MAVLDFSHIATFAGCNAHGPIFDIIVNIPDELERDSNSTDAQRAAVNRFYGQGTGENLTFSQASDLLSYREYAKSCADMICNDHSEKARLMFARLIAAFISSKPEIASYAIERSSRRFRAGTEFSRPAQSKYFGEIAGFCEHVFRELNERGIAL